MFLPFISKFPAKIVFQQNVIQKLGLPVVGSAIVAKPFTTSPSFRIKEVSVVEDGDTKTISATIKDSHRVKNLLNFPEPGCPLCNIEKLGVKIHFTDVLILNQFLTSNGKMLPRRINGLCKKQHFRLKCMVEQAKSGGLLPDNPLKWTREGFENEKRMNKHRYFNKYDDEKETSMFSDFKSKLP